MAMLAGPRRKQKVINLRAKNSSWSNDSNKFGQRMLEKMGWSSGKGLGAKENGIVEHVVARYKNDERGLGFEDKNDQWTKHEDDFNSLLANLSNADDKEIQLHSGISLEAKSKKSKTRIHYHKFTRGKDLSKYSEKDLANIFGKKSLKEKKVDTVKEHELKSNDKETEKIFTERGSMEDYFKNKMSSKNLPCSLKHNTTNENDDHENFSFHGFAGTGKEQSDSEKEETVRSFQPFSFYDSNNVSKKNMESKEINNIEVEKSTKKSKKSKTRELKNDDDDENINDQEQTENKLKKTKKSKKLKEDDEALIENQSSILKPHKKSKKRKNQLETSESIDDNNLPPETQKPKKKKKKNKDNE